MSKLPTHVTYIVGTIEGRERSLCVEASSAVRLKTFRRRAEDIRTINQPLGFDYRGHHLEVSARRALQRQIYRQIQSGRVQPRAGMTDATPAIHILTELAERHGVSATEVTNPRIRREPVRVARMQVVHALRERLDLSPARIAEVLNYKKSSCVLYWLSAPYKKRESIHRGKMCQHPRETTLRNI